MSERIGIEFKGKEERLMLVQVYVPTNDSRSDRAEGSFLLQKVTAKVGRKEAIIFRVNSMQTLSRLPD